MSKMNMSTFTVALFGKIKAWLDPRFKAAESQLENLDARLRTLECKIAAMNQETGKNG